ncbi:MAG: protein kinase domain-containing protein [Acidimicrobiia bacterium]
MTDFVPVMLAGRYRVGDLLGHGGMGEVRAATDEALDRPVAIKLLRATFAAETGLRERFEREARAAARVGHPNVIAIYDVGEQDGVPYFVMERLSGWTLADELTTGPLAEPQVHALATELLGALATAHRLGVIHRDVKPGNVLLRDDGHATLADFGIATIAQERNAPTTGVLLGTASYLAPERLAGAVATPGSDVYAVGVVLYEALTGRPAFRADTPLGLTSAVLHDVPTFTMAERSRFDPAFLEAIERAMEKEPAARFQSADAMLAAIRSSRVAPAGAPTIPYAIPEIHRVPPPTAPVRSPTAPAPTRRMASQGEPQRPRLPIDPRAPSGGRSRHRWRLGLGLAAASLAIVGAVAIIDPSDGAAPRPESPTTTTISPGEGRGIPPPLLAAIDALDRSVDG